MSHATQYRTDRWTDIGLDLIRLGGVVIRRSGLLRHDNGVGKTALGIRERDTNKQQRNTNKKQRKNSVNMSNNYKYDPKKDEEPDIVISDAIPADGPPVVNGPPVPPGHNRFYCEKCRTPYDLPNQATSWRCARCSTFNSTTPDECCIIS